MALQDPNIMPSSRLDCPLSLKTPNMGNTGLYVIGVHLLAKENADSPVCVPLICIYVPATPSDFLPKEWEYT